jgi:hypothetical protein
VEQARGARYIPPPFPPTTKFAPLLPRGALIAVITVHHRLVIPVAQGRGLVQPDGGSVVASDGSVGRPYRRVTSQGRSPAAQMNVPWRLTCRWLLAYAVDWPNELAV